MNNIDKWLFKITLFLLPLIIGFFIWIDANESRMTEILRLKGIEQKIFILMAFLTLSWILTGLYVTLKMLMSKAFRELSLRKISGLEERDEREVLMSGEAAKYSFISTLALICFLTFISVFQVEYKAYPNGNLEQQKKGHIKVEMDFAPLPKTIKTKGSENKELDEEIITYSGFPISRPVLLLLVGFWLIFSYRFKMRKQLKDAA